MGKKRYTYEGQQPIDSDKMKYDENHAVHHKPPIDPVSKKEVLPDEKIKGGMNIQPEMLLYAAIGLGVLILLK